MDVKKQISDMFEEELAKRDGDKITVKDIVDACGISRQAFYYHFQDLQAVLEWTFEKRMEKVLQFASHQEEIWQAIKILLDEIWNNRKLVKRMKESKEMARIQGSLIEVISDYLNRLMMSHQDFIILPTRDMALLIEYNASGIAALMINKCDDKEFDTEKYARFIGELIFGEVHIFEEN